jgi:DNA-binding NarL/FixJ family response regulator
MTSAQVNRFCVVTKDMTERERQVVWLVCDGMTNADIAEALGTSVSRVKDALHEAYKRLGIHDRVKLATSVLRFAYEAPTVSVIVSRVDAKNNTMILDTVA